MINPLNLPRPKETLPAYNLMREIHDAPYFKDIGKGLHRKIYQIGESNICMKVPHPEHYTPTILYMMQSEFIMYQISHIWNFDVVPFTKVILHNSKEIEEISAAFNKVHKNDRLYYPILIQNYVNSGNINKELDLHQAQKALLFNWITGRHDRAKENSAINANGQIFEIDNELTFSKIEEIHELHWLLSDPIINETPFNETLIQGVLKLPQMIPLKLETLPENPLRRRHPRAHQIKRFRNTTIEKIQNQIIENLTILKSIIHNLQKNNSQITPKIIEVALRNLGKKNYAS